MKNGCIISILITLTVIIIFLIITFKLPSGFGPDYSTVEIPQKIGGKLICDVTYTADFHSWDYDVEYKYKDKNDSIQKIGFGIYSGREIDKNVQLINFGKWTILQTGNRYFSDKVIIGSIEEKKWSEFIISPEILVTDSLWQAQRISSLLNTLPSQSLIQNIINGIISVKYVFIYEEHNRKTKKKLIYYKIDSLSGKITMYKITDDK